MTMKKCVSNSEWFQASGLSQAAHRLEGDLITEPRKAKRGSSHNESPNPLEPTCFIHVTMNVSIQSMLFCHEGNKKRNSERDSE